MAENWPLTTLTDYGLVKTTAFKTIIHDLGVDSVTGGKREQRVSKQADPTHTWKIVLKNRLTTEADSLYDFFVARKGPYEAFNITDPFDSQTYLVRFLDEMMDQEYFYTLLWNGQIKVVQVAS